MVTEKSFNYFFLLLGFFALLSTLSSNVFIQDVDAALMDANVTIIGLAPNITNIRCCYKESDVGSYADGDCKNADSGSPYTPTGGEPYDMMCNFTVNDINGWQDMTDGWVNLTWYYVNVNWNNAEDNDVLYVNSTCENITGTESGTTINFECQIAGITYWADAGNWTFHANLSDGLNVGTPGVGYFSISNVTSIWQSGQIDFGQMSPGSNGSQSNPGVVGIDAITNNTGNTIIDIRIDGGADWMNCTIGGIPVGNVTYDPTDQTTMETACGQLTSSSVWDVDCTELDIPDCINTCTGSTENTVDNTYWGIDIPDTGIGGSCGLSITIAGIQANP